ncbi:MAG: hypothetical protein ABIS50_12195 [Luteolibacter sp.]|uniref:hypothetical protein n=1 Tax=Luteolibacter sp. TaxID=1962973 RepID=UPI003265486F
MPAPRRRSLFLLALTITLSIWGAVLACSPSEILHGGPQIMMVATTPVCGSLALVLLLASGLKESVDCRSRGKSALPDWEIIPLERRRPPGFERRTEHRPIVVVPKSRVSRVIPPAFLHSRRRSLGLPEHPPFGLNRKRCRSWHRRLVP